MKTIWFNARFLDRSISGVERVAFEILSALSSEHLDKEGICEINNQLVQIKLITSSKSEAKSPWNNIELVKRGRLQGHFWEQLELPFYTHGDLLFSLCNTGPIFKRMHIGFLHDAQTFAIPENFSFKFRLWYRLMFWCIAHFSKLVLVNSKFTQTELSDYLNIDSEKFKLCRFGIEHIKKTEEQTDLTHFNLPTQPFLLAVSSANPNKNFSSVIEAIKHLGEKSPPCVIVGQMNQKHFSQVDFESAKILHLGYVTDAELSALYKETLALIYPSFYEGFGIPPLEAMSHGCPVVLSNASALPETAGEAALYCNPHDHKTIADAILKIQNDNVLRQELITMGLERASTFSWKNAALDIINAIELTTTQAGKHESIKIQQS